MPSKPKPWQCVSCGGPCDVDAVDNHGEPYKGCRRCRLLTWDEIAAIEAAAKRCKEGPTDG